MFHSLWVSSARAELSLTLLAQAEEASGARQRGARRPGELDLIYTHAHKPWISALQHTQRCSGEEMSGSKVAIC